MKKIKFNVAGKGEIGVDVTCLIVAGWAGRNRQAIEEHIRELEEMGVRRPSSVPLFYQLSSNLITQEKSIQVIDKNSSGEVECVVVNSSYGLLVTVGSDHTDRKVESYNVAISKQVCEKPIATEAWLFEEVVDHWDELVLRSYRVENGKEILYQEGITANLLSIPSLIEEVSSNKKLAQNTLMFCGTQAVIGKIKYSDCFICELYDPVLKRGIRHQYDVNALEMVE